MFVKLLLKCVVLMFGILCSYLVLSLVGLSNKRHTLPSTDLAIDRSSYSTHLELQRTPKRSTKSPQQETRSDQVPFRAKAFQHQTDSFGDLRFHFELSYESKALLSLTDEESIKITAGFMELHRKVIEAEKSMARVDRVDDEHFRITVPDFSNHIASAKMQHEHTISATIGVERSGVMNQICSDVYFEHFSDLGKRERYLDARIVRGRWRILHGFVDDQTLIVVRSGQSRIAHLVELLEEHLE